jgi:hypothetical protein
MFMLNRKKYKLALLDTNIIQKLVSDPSFARKLQERFFVQQPLSIFCLSFDNVIELRNKRRTDNARIDIYECFVTYFSKIPCMLFFPYRCLFQEELSVAIQNTTLQISKNIANVFIPDETKIEYNLKKWLEYAFLANNCQLVTIIQEEVKEMPNTASCWMKQRSQQPLNASKFGELLKTQEESIVLSFLSCCGINTDGVDFKRFPAARTMLFSQSQRVHFTKKHLVSNDVMDVFISAYAPYVDVVITEKYQADVYMKAKRIVPELNTLEILTLRDI